MTQENKVDFSDKTFIMLSLGANLGERQNNILNAIEYLSSNNIISDIKLSSFYETEPVGNLNQPWFLNNVITGFTCLSLNQLIEKCKSIECSLGRTAKEIKWQAREIDIDIIFYGKTSIQSDVLTVPHPRMHERKFVLVPAVEIAADIIHPNFGKTIKELLKICPDNSIVNSCA
ncbi:MAG: 2-amino-4-hydroxy-6-hydroxymethyldihydropteridine diphosphokinase [Bacteroidota bacterium]